MASVIVVTENNIYQLSKQVLAIPEEVVSHILEMSNSETKVVASKDMDLSKFIICL